jgi:hypothetical protein
VKYPAGISGEEYAAMESGYEQGRAAGRAEGIAEGLADCGRDVAASYQTGLADGKRIAAEEAEAALAAAEDRGARKVQEAVAGYCRMMERLASEGVSPEAIGLARAYADVADRLEAVTGAASADPSTGESPQEPGDRV